MRRLGLGLGALRAAKGMTQEEVAARAGFTGKYISECERGLRDLPVTSLRAIVENGLGCSIGQAFPSGEGSVGPVGMPSNVLDVARQIAALPTGQRRSITGIVRAALSLARSG